MSNEEIGQMQGILNDAPICCFFLDEKLGILDCNQYALDLFEAKDKDGLLNHSLTRFAPGFQRDGTPSAEYAGGMLWRAANEGLVKTEWAAATLSGKDIFAEAVCVPATFDGRDCLLLYLHELPEGHENEAKLIERREAEKRLRVIFDNLPFACNFSNKSVYVLECNQMCVDFFNLKDKQEFKDNFARLSPQYQPCGRLSSEKRVDMIRLAFQKGTNRFEWLHLDGDGDDLPTEVTLVRVRWQNEDHLLTIIRDLREVYKLVEIERAVQQRLKVLLDSSPLACVIRDDKFNIVEVNQEVVNLFEIKDKQEYIDRHLELSPVYQPDGRNSLEKRREAMRTALETGKARFGWMHKTLSGKPLPCEIVLQRVVTENDTMLICYIRDLREINNALAMVEHLEKLAYVDPLTGAHNRRYFMEEAEVQLENCVSAGKPFSIIMADIDFFKSVNDTYGHSIGDEVLKVLVARMRRVLRDVVVARYGGEEFVVLLPGVSAKDAADIAWRVHGNISSSAFSVSDGDKWSNVSIPVTASFGVASRTKAHVSVSAILQNADKALYQAKDSGRNTVVSYI